jgi:RsiW-degrading membrane proteinase PrsW (M82 family)
MGLIVSGIIGIGTSLLYAYILYWLDRYEKEPLFLLGGVFLWGSIVAAGSAFLLNTTIGIGVFIFTGSEMATDFATGSFIAPLVEEILKGMAVLIVFLIFRREFDSMLDGIIYAGIAALGFAATENVYYIYTYGYQESGWTGLSFMTFIRVVLVGWQHPFYTAFLGIGLAMARLNRNLWVKIVAPITGLVIGMLAHGLHNTLASLLGGWTALAVGAVVDWSGWLFMFTVIILVTRREKKYLTNFLSSEMQAGTITAAHLRTASSSWLQMYARFVSLFTGKFIPTFKFYQACGEYAHKRQQYASLGDESGNLAIINELRRQITTLAPLAQV